MLEIVQAARDDAQVKYEFDLLTDAIQDDIDADMQSARTKLLEELDQDVVARLKDRKGILIDTLNDFSRRLTMIARPNCQMQSLWPEQCPVRLQRRDMDDGVARG